MALGPGMGGGGTIPPTVPAHGVPAGGSTAQVLTKLSNADYDADWESIPAAGNVTLLNPESVWAAATSFAAFVPTLLPTGGWGYVPAVHVSGATFDATERAAWTFIPGGHFEVITAGGPTTWVRPSGITSGLVEVLGGGSGGGGGGSAQTAGGVATQVGGAGGACGVLNRSHVSFTSANYTVTVGSGGAGGAGGAPNKNAGARGTEGGVTSFTDGVTTVQAAGGGAAGGGGSDSVATVSSGVTGSTATTLRTNNAMTPGNGGPATSATGNQGVPLGKTCGGGGGAPATALLGGAGGAVCTVAGGGAAAATTNTLTPTGADGATATVAGAGGGGGGGGAPSGAGGAGGAGFRGHSQVWF